MFQKYLQNAEFVFRKVNIMTCLLYTSESSSSFFEIYLIRLNCVQCLSDICDQVVFIFKAAGDTDQSGWNSGSSELLVIHLAVCGGCLLYTSKA